MRTRTKLVGGYLAIAALVALVGLLGYFAMGSVDHALHEVFDEINPLEIALQDIHNYAIDYQLSIAQLSNVYLDSTEVERAAFLESETEELAETLALLNQAYADYDALVTDHFTEQTEQRDTLGELLHDLNATSERYLDALRLGALRPVRAVFVDELETVERAFGETIDAALAQANLQLIALDAEIHTTLTDTLRLTVVIVVLAVVVAAVLAILLARAIAVPITQLARASGRIASGDYTQHVTVTSRDEIGQLAEAFNTMSDRIGGLVNDLEHQVAAAEAAREQAERADKVKSAFLASVSHELRTPLNSIINFTKFVQRGVMGPVNERQVDALTKVADNGKHLLNLINDVLDMSKIESGSLTLFIEDNVDLGEIVQSAVETGESLLAGSEKPVELRADIQPVLPTIRGDRQRILQIMLNIISNACKFTEQGQIQVRAFCQDTALYFVVRDTGPGIAPEDQPLVFEAFKQTETGLRQAGGTGLGMPISKSLIEAHGGRIWLESREGEGTTFYVVLPLNGKVKPPSVSRTTREQAAVVS